MIENPQMMSLYWVSLSQLTEIVRMMKIPPTWPRAGLYIRIFSSLFPRVDTPYYHLTNKETEFEPRGLLIAQAGPDSPDRAELAQDLRVRA